jgi:hypothetical protein
MADQRAPAAADVEQRLVGLEPQLAARDIELVALRGREIVVPVGEVAARVDHLGIEKQRVEGVGEVVVILDVVLVAGLTGCRRLAPPHRLERPRLAARQQQETAERLDRQPFVEALAEFSGSDPRPCRQYVKHRAATQVDSSADPKIGQSVEFRAAYHRRHHPFVRDHERKRAWREIARHGRAVPQHEADIEPVGFTNMRQQIVEGFGAIG